MIFNIMMQEYYDAGQWRSEYGLANVAYANAETETFPRMIGGVDSRPKGNS
jgi:hypothetical protein